MARNSSTSIIYTQNEEYDEIKSWKKARQDYINNFGKYLLKCNETEIIQIFDEWEHNIIEHESIDKIQNYMTALLTISILHHFNRSYDQIKEYIPFMMKMLQHKSRLLNKVSSLVFKYLAIELNDNIEFLRDLMTNYVSTWIETLQTRYSGMLILNVSGKFYFSSSLLPSVFEISMNQYENLWDSAISDDVQMRTLACKCIDTQLRGLPLVSSKNEREEIIASIFERCLKQLKSHPSMSHGAVLICSSIFKNSLYHLVDLTNLNLLLIDVSTYKSELLDISTFSLLLEILKKMPHLFNSDIIQSIFTNLINACTKFTTNSQLFYLIDEFVKYSNPHMVPVNFILNFLKTVVKSPRYKMQQQIGFIILKTIFVIFKDVSVPASFFLDTEPSSQYLEALKLRIPLLNELKNTLFKHFSDGLGPKATKNQALLSLNILKTFKNHLFNDNDSLFTQISDLTVSKFIEVRAFVAEVLPLFQNQSAFDELIVLALFDDSKLVRLNATKQLNSPEKVAHKEIISQILDDPSFKVRRAAIPIVANFAPLNPLLFVDHISLFVEKSIRSIMSSSDSRECARLSSLFPLIAEFFIPHCEAFIPQIVKLCILFLRQRSKNINNNKNGENENIENDFDKQIEINEIPYVDLSHDDFPLILNKHRFDKNNTNMRLIFQIETQEWIDIRDTNLILTIQKLVGYLTPYINEIVDVFLNIFSLSNASEFVLSSALDAFIEIVQKLSAASDIPSTNRNLIVVLMALLRKQASSINSITATIDTIATAVKEATGMTRTNDEIINISTSLESIYLNNQISNYESIITTPNSNDKFKYKYNAYDLSNSRKILSSNSSVYSIQNNYVPASCAISVAVKILILMGKMGVNTFPICRSEKSNVNDPISDYDFRSPSFYTEFIMSELLKLMKESNSSIYEVIAAIFAKESEIASRFLGTIVDSFSESLAINKGPQKDILFNSLEVICYFCSNKMTPYTNILLPHIIKNVNNISALRVAIILSYNLKTEFIPTIQPLFQIALHFFHKVYSSKLTPIISKPQQINKISFSLMNLKSLLSPSSTSNSNSQSGDEADSNSSNISTNFSSTKYKIPSVTNDSIKYIETLLKFLTAAVIFQNQPIGLFVSECEQAITHILPKNNLPLSSTLIERLSLILHSLITIVQLGDASFECSNITRICIRLLKTPLTNLVYQLLFSLSIYCHLSPDVIDFLASEENMSNHSIQTLRDYLKDRMIPLDKFLVKKVFNVSIKVPDCGPVLSRKQRQSIRIPQPSSHSSSNSNDSNKKISATSSSSATFMYNDVCSSSTSDSFPKSSSTVPIATNNVNNNVNNIIETSKSYSSIYYSYVFKDFPPPQFLNIEKWLEDLCNVVVQESPSVSIRSCYKIVQHSPSFRKIIFPIAFLSCWRITQMNDRVEFSKTIQPIFENENKVVHVFLKLAELLLRVGYPFIISNFIIAKSCKSPAMAFRFLVRHLKEKPTDCDAIELILTLNMRLGRIDSSAGILKTVKLPTAGTWYEKIGDWSNALKFYMKNHHQKDLNNNDFNTNEISPILRCYANLEQWSEIRKLSHLFDKMNESEKQENSVWFAWAFYKINDLYKVYTYVKKIEETESLNMILFKQIFYVASDQSEKAKESLYKMMQILIRDCSIYSALNANQADENLTYANYLVEIQEALEYKSLKMKTINLDSILNQIDEDDLSDKKKEIVKRWRRRLEYHNGDALSWLRLVEICNLAVRVNENQKIYLKLLSVLLKKRRFEIIHAYWSGMLQVIYDPAVQIMYHKIQWELGKKRQAIQSLHLLRLVYESDNLSKDEFRKEFDLIPQFVKDTFYNDFIKPISATAIQTENIGQIQDKNENIIESKNGQNEDKSEAQKGSESEAQKGSESEVHEGSKSEVHEGSESETNNSDESFEKFYGFGEILRKMSKLTPKEKGRFYRIEATFRSQLYQKNESLSNLVKTIDLYSKACDLTPDDYRNWAGFAYAASRAIGSCSDNLNCSFVHEAMHGFLKATQLHQTNNLVFLLQLFSLFFRYGGKIAALGVPDEIVNLGPEVIIQILPQIVCQINHGQISVQKVVHEILVRFSEKHFQALVFSLHVLITSEDKEKSSIAAKLLEELSFKHAKLASEAKMLVEGLMRAAVTWYEMWLQKLDAEYLASTKNNSNNYDACVNILKSLFNSVSHPKCRLDRQFIEKTKTAIATCSTSIDQFVLVQMSINNLWFQLKRLYHFLKDKFNDFESIELQDVSEDLYNYRNFELSIPGTYKVTPDNESNKENRIFKIDPKLEVLSTQQNPRLLYMFDMSGKKWKFLLKGNEDLRVDQRIMQFFNLINTLIKTHKATSDLGVTIQKYPIIPFAQNAGLISWVVGADTLHELVMNYRKSKMIPSWVENDWIKKFAIPQQFDLLLSVQKCEIWNYVSASFPANELQETFWEKTPDSVSWIQCIDTFSLTTALMSMAGYIIGLGDRHPSNILIQRQTGHVIHIDLGDSFEVSLNREKMPEKVPFRLTRMIVNTFGVSGLCGTFRSACVKIMRVLRENKSSIIAQLEIFVHEPIFQNRYNESSSEGKNHILDRIIQKLNGKDPVGDDYVPCFSRPISNSPSRRNSTIESKEGESDVEFYEDENESVIIDEEEGRNETDSDELNVEEQVDRLIKIASDPYRYVQHYLGWCQFW